MQKLIVIGFAALCLIGTSSLALADEAMKSEMGGMKDEMKAEKNAMKSDMKAKKEEMKGKTKEQAQALYAEGYWGEGVLPPSEREEDPWVREKRTNPWGRR